MVPTDSERFGFLALEVAADHPSGFEVRQHFYYRHDWIGENWGFGAGYLEEQEFRQICKFRRARVLVFVSFRSNKAEIRR